MYQPKEANIKGQAAILACEAVALAFLNFLVSLLFSVSKDNFLIIALPDRIDALAVSCAHHWLQHTL